MPSAPVSIVANVQSGNLWFQSLRISSIKSKDGQFREKSKQEKAVHTYIFPSLTLAVSYCTGVPSPQPAVEGRLSHIISAHQPTLKARDRSVQTRNIRLMKGWACRVTNTRNLGGKSWNHMPSYECTRPLFQRNAPMAFRSGSDSQHPHPARGGSVLSSGLPGPLGWQVEVSVCLHMLLGC